MKSPLYDHHVCHGFCVVIIARLWQVVVLLDYEIPYIGGYISTHIPLYAQSISIKWISHYHYISNMVFPFYSTYS